MSPRSILKGVHRISLENLNSNAPSIAAAPFPFSSCSSLSPHVHFPPTPTLTSTFDVDHYDRSSIPISPNICLIPNRGERVYQSTSPPCYPQQSQRRRSSAMMGSYFHPRAFEACTTEHDATPPTPLSQLDTPELSLSPDDSETDDGSPRSPLSPQLGTADSGNLIPFHDVDGTRLQLALPPKASSFIAGADVDRRRRGHEPTGPPEPHRQLRRLKPKRPDTLTSSNVRAPLSDAIVFARRRSALLSRPEHKSFSHGDSCCLDGF